MYQLILTSAVLTGFLISTSPAAAQDFKPSREVVTSSHEIDKATLRGHISYLADDLLEGRGPGTIGDRLAQLYVRTQLSSMGIQPAASDRSWVQPVPLVGLDTDVPPVVNIENSGKRLSLKRGSQFMAVSGRATALSGFQDAELVFVGYGIEAPEYEWNDFKDVDVSGKILVVMNNDPADDEALFAGNTRLYYGRWSYKFEQAARKGAIGAIVIHTTESAGYPWQVVQTSWSGEQFYLRDQSDPRCIMEAWMTEQAAREVVALGGHDLDQLRASAQKRSFRPVALGSTMSVVLNCKVSHQETANVLGMIKGSDPVLRKEFVVVTAHHDHIGIAAEGVAGKDRIYNGALDNASGVSALLAIAKAFASLETPPRRSILFAAVGAEEQGLLGSKYLAADPPIPAGYMAACVNIDGINIWGKTNDLMVIGHGKSNLDDTVNNVAQWQKRVTLPDQFPDKGYYYRSDQFSLAKVGVPGVYLDGGTDFVGRPEGWGKAMVDEWIEKHYHQPSDEYSSAWDLAGAELDVRLLYLVANEIANRDKMPEWRAGDEFEAIRKKEIGRRDAIVSSDKSSDRER